MSGYLQRMAASAARPQRRVHPLVGDMFSRPAERPVEEVGSAIARSDVHAHTVRPPVSERLPIVHVEFPGETHSDIENGVRFSKPMLPARQEPSGLVRAENQLGEAEMVESAGVRGETPVVSSAEVAPRQPRMLLPDVIRRLTEPEAPQSGVPQTHLRSRTEPGSSAEKDTVLPSIVEQLTTHPQGPSRRQSEPPLSAQRPHLPSGDIQIHIGRIEVIATPPPAPRAAPGPVRRGPTLAEYLERRDRRSR